MNVIEIPFDAARTFVEDAHSVLFFARVGERSVRCYVTRLALVTYFGARVEDDGKDTRECLRAFDANAARIKQIAREFIVHRGGGTQSVVITTDDVFRSVARVHRPTH